MDTVYREKCDCTGCGMCRYICHNNAIDMKCDSEGFLYPVIDSNKCVDCNLCRKMCPNYADETVRNAEYFGVKHKNDSVRAKSTSGGVFVALSDWFLRNNGSICGCILDNDLKAVHVMAYDEKDRNLMCDSKYTQSDISNIYDWIANDLDEGKKVLFTGTPCQAEAIRRSMENNKNSHNLYICDFVCHGVPSPKIFKDYLKYIENREKIQIEKVEFRAKQLGWAKNNKRMLKFNDKHNVYYDDTFYKLYFNYNVVSRPCCEECKFTSVHKKIDFTMGDFWGIEKFYKDFDDQKGVSLLILHSEKARKLFDIIKDDLDFIKSDKEKVIKDNPRLETPTVFGVFRKQLFIDYNRKGYKYIVKKYVSPSVLRRSINKIKRITKGVIKHV